MLSNQQIKRAFIVTFIFLCPTTCLATGNIISRFPSGTDICAESGLIYIAYVDVDDDPSTGVWVGTTWYPNETQVPLYPTQGSLNINPPDELGLIRYSFVATDCNEPGWETKSGKFVIRFVDVLADGWVWNDPTTWQPRQVMSAKVGFSHGDISNFQIYNGPDDPGNVLNPNPKIEVVAYESWEMVNEVDRATGSGDHSLSGKNTGFSELVFLTDFDDSEVHYIELSMIPEPDPVNPGTDGLVAYYSLENDANDSSGNGHHGTIVGDPIFVKGLADYGMALDLDGIDDLVELGKFDVVDQITLAAWIKADDFEINDARVITKAKEWGGNDHWWMLSTISETSLRFRLKTDDGQDTATLLSDPVLEAGVWANVAATWDGSTMRIYKDGVEIASQEKGGSAVAVDPDISVAIGSQPSDAFASDPSHVAKFFDGLIDEVQIYERALSGNELLYLAGERAIPVDPGTNGLVACYAMENNTDDSSGNGNNGTINGTSNWMDGKIGSALEFDGSSTYVEIPFSESLRLLNQGDFTLSSWFKADEIPPENKEVFQQGDANGTGRTWLFVHNSNEIRSYLGGGTTASGIGVEAGVWMHAAVVVTEGGDADTVQLYVNGERAGEPLQRSMEDCEGVYFIGRHKNPTNFWDGLMDEIQLYNRGLYGGEIRYLAGYRADTDDVDPSLAIYYTFDEVGDVVADQSGKGHDGVVVGEVSAEPEGMVAGAAKFANAAYLDLDGPNFAAEDIPTSGITLAAWIKCENTGSHHAIFNARASDQTWLVHPEARSNGEFRWLLRSYGGTTMFDIRAGAVTWDEWLYFAGTYDKASAKSALCINGELVSEIDVANPDDIAGDWDLGARVGKNIDDARPFTGLMDEFRMLTRALSQDEILDMMTGI